jgi:hypothetical protein
MCHGPWLPLVIDSHSVPPEEFTQDAFQFAAVLADYEQQYTPRPQSTAQMTKS